jgi:hypothetical protein
MLILSKNNLNRFQYVKYIRNSKYECIFSSTQLYELTREILFRTEHNMGRIQRFQLLQRAVFVTPSAGTFRDFPPECELILTLPACSLSLCGVVVYGGGKGRKCYFVVSNVVILYSCNELSNV